MSNDQKKRAAPGERQAERALLRRALGYDVVEEKVQVGGIHDGEVVKTSKHVPAETRALIFFLKNRLPDRWRERQPPIADAPDPGPDPLVEALRGFVWPED